jgi:hypothetical protein
MLGTKKKNATRDQMLPKKNMKILDTPNGRVPGSNGSDGGGTDQPGS